MERDKTISAEQVRLLEMDRDDWKRVAEKRGKQLRELADERDRLRAGQDRWLAAEIRQAKVEGWEACASIAEELIEDGIRPGDAEEHLRNPYRDQIEAGDEQE